MSSERVTNTDCGPGDSARWLVGLLQATDSFFPTGSYAHSFGLEGFVQEGIVRDLPTLREFLQRSVMPALRHGELPLAAHAWRAFGEPNWSDLGELCALSSAVKAPRELRLASENIGRQRAELAAHLHASPLAREFLAQADAHAWPHSTAVSAALEARIVQAPVEAMLSALYYSNLLSCLAASMKLLRIGQNAAQSLLTETLADAPPIIAAAQETPRDQIGWFNPWLDIAAARHETADSRMFIS